MFNQIQTPRSLVIDSRRLLLLYCGRKQTGRNCRSRCFKLWRA